MAQQDLDLAAEFTFKKFGQKTGREFLRRVERAYVVIQTSPESGRMGHLANGKKYRLHVLAPYVLCYRFASSRVEIIAFLHGKRDISYALEQRM